MQAHPLCGGALAASDIPTLLMLLKELISELLRGCNDQGALTYLGYITLPKRQTWGGVASGEATAFKKVAI